MKHVYNFRQFAEKYNRFSYNPGNGPGSFYEITVNDLATEKGCRGKATDAQIKGADFPLQVLRCDFFCITTPFSEM